MLLWTSITQIFPSTTKKMFSVFNKIKYLTICWSWPSGNYKYILIRSTFRKKFQTKSVSEKKKKKVTMSAKKLTMAFQTLCIQNPVVEMKLFLCCSEWKILFTVVNKQCLIHYLLAAGMNFGPTTAATPITIKQNFSVLKRVF